MNFDYAGIGEASQLLGLSRTSVQRLVDTNELSAFKTVGGHRRILRASIEAFRMKRDYGGQPEWTIANNPVGPKLGRYFPVLVVEGNADEAAVLVKSLAARCPETKLTVATDWLEAALCIGRARPRILIMNLNLLASEGFENLAFIKMLAARLEYQSIKMVVYSQLRCAEFQIRDGLPVDTVFFEHPLNFDRLKGFIEAHYQLYRPALQANAKILSSSQIKPGLRPVLAQSAD
jgi:excisionase family DNA binding protein